MLYSSNERKGPKPAARAQPAPDVVLTKAVLRAAELLELPGAALARTLGVSEASISRLSSGARTVDPKSKEGELALLSVRVYRSLDALVGTDAAQRKAWLHTITARSTTVPRADSGRRRPRHGLAYLDAMPRPA